MGVKLYICSKFQITAWDLSFFFADENIFFDRKKLSVIYQKEIMEFFFSSVFLKPAIFFEQFL